MIDLGLAIGGSFSEWWGAPMGSVSVAWRPTYALEVQASGTMAWFAAGGFSAAGREVSRCFCDGMVDRVAADGSVTFGVFPLREEVGTWQVEVGLRLGGAVVHVRPAEYLEWADDVNVNEGPAFMAPGWTVEAVAGVGVERYGLRVRLQQLNWISVSLLRADRALAPRLEGYVRW